ncbi:unnamed protein product [Heterosigma akashiwo]
MSDQDQLFGADFLAAINTSQKLDIPLFTGDEYAQETASKFLRTAFLPETYDPSPLLRTLLREKATNMVDIPGAFVSDPFKLAPLIITISPALILLLFTLQRFQYMDFTADASLFLSLVVSFVGSCKVFNTLIADRDDVLSSSALRARHVIAALKDNKTIRKRWTFTIPTSVNAAQNSGQEFGGHEQHALPLFTLKTPLKRGMVRNLNLFEPRWLRMVDSLNISTPSTSSEYIGCVSCTNKFYSAVNINGTEGGIMDVIFERKGALAQVSHLRKLSARPGTQKCLSCIEGMAHLFWMTRRMFGLSRMDISWHPNFGLLKKKNIAPMIKGKKLISSL